MKKRYERKANGRKMGRLNKGILDYGRRKRLKRKREKETDKGTEIARKRGKGRSERVDE